MIQKKDSTKIIVIPSQGKVKIIKNVTTTEANSTCSDFENDPANDYDYLTTTKRHEANQTEF